MGLAKLQTRGWTLQETHLASRVLYYNERGLYWQCREGIRQERAVAYLIMANDLVVPRRRIFDSYSDDPLNIFVLWQDLVKEFTDRKLTYESDKLFAIAGIASAVASFIKSRQHRRLATPEESEMYSSRKLPKHWAVPDNPQAVGSMRHDGGNASLRWILSKPGGRGTLYMGGPLSMDPWLGLRFAGELDRAAEREFADPGPETREIMKSEGMGDLLKFVDDKENPDYDDEYTHLMSHQDTHAAYLRAYYIWLDKRKKSHCQITDRGDETSSTVQSTSLDQEVAETSETPGSTTDSEQRVQDGLSEGPVQGSEKVEEQAQDGKNMELPVASQVVRDQVSPLSKKLQMELAAVQDGVHLDPDMEIATPIPQQAAIYVYGDDDPVKARIEWPAFVSDDTYLAGIWKADLISQLQWRRETPGTRPAAYRAPTWSWASMDSATIGYDNKERYAQMEGYVYTRLPRLLDARVVPLGDNSFGDAHSARLVLLADVRDMPLHADPGLDALQLDGQDEGSDSDGVLLTDRGFPDMFPGKDSDLVMDEHGQLPGPMLKLLRLSYNFCLIIDLVDVTRDPLVGKRVGCWTCTSDSFADYDEEKKKGMVGWESKTVILV